MTCSITSDFIISNSNQENRRRWRRWRSSHCHCDHAPDCIALHSYAHKQSCDERRIYSDSIILKIFCSFHLSFSRSRFRDGMETYKYTGHWHMTLRFISIPPTKQPSVRPSDQNEVNNYAHCTSMPLSLSLTACVSVVLFSHTKNCWLGRLYGFKCFWSRCYFCM